MSVKRKLLLYLLTEEMEDEDVLEMVNVPRLTTHTIFKSREDEGYFKILISNHLICDDTKFSEFFRLSKEQFTFLVNLVKNGLKKSSSNCNPYPISVEEKIGLTLRFLATGESFHSLQFQFRISVSEISSIVKETLKMLKEKLVPLFLPNLSQQQLEHKANEYGDKWNFPNCVGAIDGKHVRIKCPENSASLFYNYKGFFSIVLLAIVDANYKFMYIDVGSYGKEGDSGIFEKSKLGSSFYAGTLLPPPKKIPNSDLVLPHVLVGDDAFRLHTNLMKPYQREDALKHEMKSVFNYRICRARRTSENSFGLLSQVFRIFYTPISVTPHTLDDIITVSCCLHNMLRDGYLSNTGHASYEFDATEKAPTNNLISMRRTGGYANVQGLTVRNTYASYFVNEGKVSWKNILVKRTDTTE